MTHDRCILSKPLVLSIVIYIYTPVRVQPEKKRRDTQEVFVTRSWLAQVQGWLGSLARAGSPTQVMDLKSLWGRESGRGSRAGWNPTSMSWSPGSGETTHGTRVRVDRQQCMLVTKLLTSLFRLSSAFPILPESPLWPIPGGSPWEREFCKMEINLARLTH